MPRHLWLAVDAPTEQGLVLSWLIYSNNDGRLGGKLIRHVNEHLDLGRVCAKVLDLRQRRAQRSARGGHEAEDGREEHDGAAVGENRFR